VGDLENSTLKEAQGISKVCERLTSTLRDWMLSSFASSSYRGELPARRAREFGGWNERPAQRAREVGD